MRSEETSVRRVGQVVALERLNRRIPGGRRSVYDRGCREPYRSVTGGRPAPKGQTTLKYMNRNTHVLVVDDEPESCELVQDYLTGEGYRVSTAHDGATMRRMIAQNLVNLVILDLSCPMRTD